MGIKDLSKIDAELDAFGKTDDELGEIASRAVSDGACDLSEADALLESLAEGVTIARDVGNGVSNWPEDDTTDQVEVQPVHAGAGNIEDADDEFVLMVDDDAFIELLDDDIEEIDLEADLVEHINSSNLPPKTTSDSFMKKLLRKKR